MPIEWRRLDPTGRDVSDTQSNPGITPLPARDEVAALASAGGDADLAAELFDALLDGLPAEIEDLRGCLAESDWPGLAEHAHQVRGATRYCGVPALDEAIEALERAAKIGDPVLIQAGFTQVEAEAQRLRHARGGIGGP
jgi:two-component system sensor histidine kinase BarA